MIGEVQKALTAYNRLDGTGKRLFRDELGLKRPQQLVKKRKARTVGFGAPQDSAPITKRGRRDARPILGAIQHTQLEQSPAA